MRAGYASSVSSRIERRRDELNKRSLSQSPAHLNSRSTEQWKDVPRGTMDEVSSYVRLNLSFKLTTRPRQRLFYLVLESHDGRAPGADSEEKREAVSDIDTVVADSLKVLDLKRPIREGGHDPMPARYTLIARVPLAEAASTNEQVSAVDNYLFSARKDCLGPLQPGSRRSHMVPINSIKPPYMIRTLENDELVMIRRRERPDVDRLAHGQVAGVVGMEIVPRQLGELAVGQVLRLHVAGRRV